MRQRWHKFLAPLMATLLLAGMLGAAQPPVYAAEATPSANTELAPPPAAPAEGPEGSSLPASSPAASSGTAPSSAAPASSAAPPSSSVASSSPSSAPASSSASAASVSSSSSSSSSSVSESESLPSSSIGEETPLVDLDAWLQELTALARTDAAAAAELLNAQTDEEAYLAGLKAILDIYYGEELSEELSRFSSGLDARAEEILAAYAKAAAERAAALAQGFIPGEVVVIFEPGIAKTQAAEVAAEHDTTLAPVAETETPEVCAVAELPLDQTVAEAITTLQADPAVQYAQPNFLYTTDVSPTPNDPGRTNMWYTAANKVDIPGAWELLQNAGLNPAANQVRVAVLDTAIMAAHPDLQANLDTANGLWDFQNSQSTGGVKGLPASFDGAVSGDASHGTHVTGIVGATGNNGIGTYGVASGMGNNYIRLSAYNVFMTNSIYGRYEVASSYDVATALNHAVGAGARVINMSLGYLNSNPSYEDLIMKNAMQNAWNKDVVVVTSAGNNGSASPHIPGSFGLSIDVINLRNVDYTNRSLNPRSNTSNYGSTKTISAPGSSIYSTVGIAGAASYANLSGTSMAAPIVTGVVAMVRYANPTLTVAQVHQIIKETATDTYTPGFDDQTAWGCINAKAAVQKALAANFSGWVQKSDGLYYYLSNGLPATGWQTIGGSRYYFSGQGKASVGLCTIDGNLYYFAADGKMQTGMLQINNAWYYMAANGQATKGWVQDASGYRFFGSDGRMQTGIAPANGSWYLFSANGYMQTGSGWVLADGWVYMNPDGRLSTGWVYDGSWYYLNPDNSAKMATGWVLTGSGWYYMNGSGQMQTGWLHDGSGWYYAAASGLIQTGWMQENGIWYYFNPQNGYRMATGWVELGSGWYYMNGSGQMQTGWLHDGSGWYYAAASGQIHSGWMLESGSWYYFNPQNGYRMATGWAETGSGWYYMNGSGQMQTGWLHDGSGWFYLNSGGQMQTGWLYDGESWYYMNGSGRMQTGWILANDSWYYMNSSGRMQTGWQYLGGQWFWLYPDGHMATGNTMVDSHLNSFSANGVWRGAA